MEALSNIVVGVSMAALSTQSPIEGQMLRYLMRRRTFVLCQIGDEPVGEGRFIFPQAQVGNYRADFLIRCIGYGNDARVYPPKAQCTVAVECDGHDFHTTPEQVAYDKKRDAYFLEHGIPTLRFTGREIHNNISYCIDQIEHKIDTHML